VPCRLRLAAGRTLVTVPYNQVAVGATRPLPCGVQMRTTKQIGVSIEFADNDPLNCDMCNCDHFSQTIDARERCGLYGEYMRAVAVGARGLYTRRCQACVDQFGTGGRVKGWAVPPPVWQGGKTFFILFGKIVEILEKECYN